jgi:hypothetical protein
MGAERHVHAQAGISSHFLHSRVPRAAWPTATLLNFEAEMLVYDVVRRLKNVHAFEPEKA